MTDPRTATQELQTQTIDWIRKSQDAVVDALLNLHPRVHRTLPGCVAGRAEPTP